VNNHQKISAKNLTYFEEMPNKKHNICTKSIKKFGIPKKPSNRELLLCMHIDISNNKNDGR